MKLNFAKMVACIVVLLTLVSPRSAEAQQPLRVVVMPFGGPQGASVRADLVANLARHGVDVVPASEVRTLRQSLDLPRRLDTQGVVMLATRLEASTLISGVVSRRRRRWGVTVTIRSGATGERLQRATWGGRRLADVRRLRRNAFGRLRETLESAQVPPALVTASDTEPSPWYAQGSEAIDDEDPRDIVEESDGAGETRRAYDAFRIAVAGGTLFRQMQTSVETYATHRGQVSGDPAIDSRSLLRESRSYRSPGMGHLELGFRAELYPGAFGEDPFPFLGLVGAFRQSAFLVTNAADRDTREPFAVGTSQYEGFIGVRGRGRLGEAREALELYGEAGYGVFHFDFDLANLQRVDLTSVIPPLQKGYVQLVAGATIGLVPEYLWAGLEAGYRVGTATGIDERNVWGVDTGPSDGFRGSVTLRLEIPEVRGFFLGIEAAYFAFWTDYQGQTGCAVAGGCREAIPPWEDTRSWETWPVDQDTMQVQGVTETVFDHFVRLNLQVGYAWLD